MGDVRMLAILAMAGHRSWKGVPSSQDIASCSCIPFQMKRVIEEKRKVRVCEGDAPLVPSRGTVLQEQAREPSP